MAPDIQKIIERKRSQLRKERKRRAALNKTARTGRRRVVLKVVACVCVLAVFFALGLFVGDSSYHATIIGWLPFLMAVVLLPVAFGYVRLLAATVHFSENAENTEVERNADVRFSVEFANRGPLFAFSMAPWFYVSDLFGNKASEASTALSLAPFEQTELGFSTTFEHVGTYEAGLDRVEFTDFIGLFEVTSKNNRHFQVQVLPKIQPIGGIHFSLDAVEETAKPQRAVTADSMNYATVRDYVPGDPLKSVHWKLSARADKYMTRLYERYTNPGVAVIMDFYGPSNEALILMEMFDAVVESGFSVAQYARERGMDTVLYFRDKDKRTQMITSWNKDELATLVESMPTMQNDPIEEMAVLDILTQEITTPAGKNNLVVCSASFDSQLISQLTECKLRGRAPFLVAVVPSNVLDADREVYCAPLGQLESFDIPYIIISNSNELRGVVM